MDERLISLNAAIKTAHLPVIDDAGYEVVRMDDILALPTVDAVPVVHCADCIRYHPDGNVWGWCTVSGKMRYKDYCSYGVRKDGDGK